MEPDAIVTLGVVTAAHGLKGEVAYRPYNRASELPLPGMPVLLVDPEGKRRAARVRDVRPAPRGLRLTFRGVDDRTAAEALRGLELAVRRADLPPLEEGEYYWEDVLGAEVRLADGTVVGRVADLFRGATDVLVIRGDGGERLVPVAEGFVAAIGPGGVVLEPAALEAEAGP